MMIDRNVLLVLSDSSIDKQKTPNDLNKKETQKTEREDEEEAEAGVDTYTKIQSSIIEEVDKAESFKNEMNSHATATQALNLQSSGGQPSVVGVGHHRNYSQPSVGGVTGVNTNTSGDPWFLQSTGHQMQIPPQAPLRHNKRLAPQPVGGSILLQQTQHHHSQSQPYIGIPTAIPTGEFKYQCYLKNTLIFRPFVNFVKNVRRFSVVQCQDVSSLPSIASRNSCNLNLSVFKT